MTGGILANWAGIAAALIIVAVYVFVIALVIICLIRASRYFMTSGKEQKLLRIEMGKLAEEVHQLRKELKGPKEKESSAESG